MKTIGSEKFKKWIKNNGKYARIGNLLKAPRITLSVWANGHSMPSAAARWAISEITGGEVSAEMWYYATDNENV